MQKLNGNLLKNCGGGKVEVSVHVLIYAGVSEEHALYFGSRLKR